MTITALPTVPSRSAAPNSFGTRFPPFLAALPLFRSELLGEFPASLPPIPLAGATGLVLTDLPAGFQTLLLAWAITDTSTQARKYRLRFGTNSALSSTTADYSVSGTRFTSSGAFDLRPENGIFLNLDTDNKSVFVASLSRLGSGNTYTFESVCFNVLRTNVVHGTLNVGGQIGQLALDDDLTPATPFGGGFAEISWS